MKSFLDRVIRRLKRRLRPPELQPRGCVDLPAAQEKLSRTLPVDVLGWALDGFGPVKSVNVVLGGAVTVPARLGLARPDVREAFKDSRVSLDAGWSASVDLSSWPEPRVRVQVLVRTRTGKELTLSDRIHRIRSDDLVGSIDTPARVTGTVLNIRGRALVGGRCPAKVEIELDGTRVGRARLRLPTGDPETVNPAVRFAGFEHTVVLDDSSRPTRHTVDALVPGSDGSRLRLGSRNVEVRSRQMTARDEDEAASLRAKTQQAADSASPLETSASSDRGLRLLVFTHQLDLGGGQLYLQELLRQLIPNLEACTVVCPVDGELRNELEQLGADVVISGLAPPSDHVAYEGQVRHHTMLTLGLGCDAVLVNTLSDFCAVDAVARLGVPAVWAIHESFDVDHWLEMRFGLGGPHPYVAERMKVALRAATTLVFESQATSEMFARYAPPERRLVVPYGVDVEAIVEYEAAFDRRGHRRRYDLDAEGTVLLCVGTVEERKAQACLVEAFAAVAGKHPDTTLVMVGDRAGHYSSALHGVIDSLALGRRVRLLPATSDIEEWYALSDVLVSASDVESLPRSMLEAMAFGVPVLSAAVFGVPELIQDGENGWLFEPRDMRALTRALDRVLSLWPEERQAIGCSGQALVCERHRSTNYGEAYAELFRELTARAEDVVESPGEASGEHSARARTAPVDDKTARTWQAVRPFTMTSPERVAALCDAVRYIARNSIPGDIVECGVWRGGSMLAAARTLVECGDTARTLWLYDTFSGMTAPTASDTRMCDGARAADLLSASGREEQIWAVAQLEDVERTMSLCAYPTRRVRYVAGPVEETIPATAPAQVALLRLDTDWYESTFHELVHLFPRISPGGILIVDDYDFWEGVRRAVDEYLSSIDKPVFLSRIDMAGRLAFVTG